MEHPALFLKEEGIYGWAPANIALTFQRYVERESQGNATPKKRRSEREQTPHTCRRKGSLARPAAYILSGGHLRGTVLGSRRKPVGKQTQMSGRLLPAATNGWTLCPMAESIN
jgi:hypothetical protein